MLKEAHLRVSKRVPKGWRDFTPNSEGDPIRVLLTRHFGNSLIVDLFLEFEP